MPELRIGTWWLVGFLVFFGAGCEGDERVTEGDSDADVDADTDIDGAGDADRDGDADGDVEAGTDADIDVETLPDGDPGDADEDEPLPRVDYGVPGPYTVTTEDGQYGASCRTPYRVFTPTDAPAGPLVVLSHGFQRRQANVADVARHYATWGLRAATMNLCHAGITDNQPERDAADLRGLADLLGAEAVLYVGHSAGGLRVVLAARDDPGTVAVLGLDLVDRGEMALEAARTLTVPLHGILGEPGSCNERGNGAPVYEAAAEGNAVRVTEAEHCDFEAPTDGLCTALCAVRNTAFTEEQIRATVLGLSTSFLIWQSGLDPRGMGWWTPGTPAYDEMIAGGAVTQL